MSKLPNRNNIGIHLMGHDGWIAGTIYVQNLLRALRLLPVDERGKVFLLRGPRASEKAYQSLRNDADGALPYDFRQASTRSQKALRIGYALTRARWPVSLERQCRSNSVSSVFPVTGNWPGCESVASLTWIPDFQHCHFPEFFSDKMRRERDRHFQQLIDQGSVAVVSSKDARQDLFRFFKADPERIAVLPFVSMASPDWYPHAPREVARRFGLPERFMIFPSQFWLHKNHATLFEAMAICRDRGLDDLCLVCTGHLGDSRWPNHVRRMQALIRDRRLEYQIRIMGLLQRQDQIQLLRSAVAVIQPSLFEGWSAIVEDARTLAKTMLVSDIGVHREQDPARCLYFDPRDPEALATKLMDVWPSLAAGPDREQEIQAHEEHLNRGREFVRLYLSIVQRAIDLGPNPARLGARRSSP